MNSDPSHPLRALLRYYIIWPLKSRNAPIWLVSTLIAIAAIWIATFARIEAENNEIEELAYVQAKALSNSYAVQLKRTVDQIDQITLNLQYLWKKTNGAVNLEEQAASGLYPLSAKLYISISDKDGIGITSTIGGGQISVADREYFQFHKFRTDTRLRVENALSIGRRSGKTVVRFSRRLEDVNGNFDGVISIGVEPGYLASFSDENSLGSHDFMSVRHQEGKLLVTKKGKEIKGLEAHRTPPLFEEPSGVVRVSGSAYVDNEPRVLAWQKLDGFPLISYVGLAEGRHFASQQAAARLYCIIAAVATAFLMIAAMAGMFFSCRLAWRKKQADEIKNTYHLAVDTSHEGFYMMRPLFDAKNAIEDFVVEDCNERGAQLIGLAKNDLIGAKLSIIYSGQQGIFRHAMEAGFYEDEIIAQAATSEEKTWIHRRLVRSGMGLAVTLRDITESKLHEQTLRKIANTDALTGLPNRHWLLANLPQWLATAQAEGSLLAVLYIDLDGFKNINDSLGHSAGDSLLKEVAIRLQSLMRESALIARLGGDEFTIVLKQVSTKQEVEQVAARITQAFRKPFEISGRKSTFGTSVGISLFPQDGDSQEVLLQKADIAMYAAKEDGKGRYRFYAHELYERINSQLEKEHQISQAVLEDQFVMHYQPRANTITGELTGLEALVRWNHPVRGLVYPDEFIPLAEQTGLIIRLGEMIIEKVVAQLAFWKQQGEEIVPVSVNISANQFNSGGIVELIQVLLDKYDIPAAMLEVELTESTMMNEAEHVLAQIYQLNKMGVKMHVDDFGTGYSSLSRLQEFNLHVLKIDRAFTSQLGQSREAEILFNTIVKMANALSMGVIAEGVETEEQLEIIQSLSCEEVQGYYLSKPIPAELITQALRQRFLFPQKFKIDYSSY
jgi:diguanylate cyclase (GGDEF)-like protein